MVNTIDFSEKKSSLERGASVKEILEENLEASNNYTSVLVVSLDKDGEINLGYSWESSLQALGMLEVAKNYILNVIN
ncbi:hypothetical protein [Streptococcus mitis]|jgi:hypothetical protein|uniref:Uncharacterized protein n=1 Tax=Streptococcus mitis TaxID=28037 RepID=A0A1X1K5X3_STRMT|nr:hypothetical protein [Streptococcus mitis]ORO94755.1 hypothetical protein B7698_05790 [Streptococcus mitis]DAQ40598.1 MAG TPA: hypothetical protein [Bacteriophage sp.]